MTNERRRELELVAELVLSKADLKVTKEIGAVRTELASIPPLIDKKIADYDDKQISRRRWTIRTIIGIGGLVIALAGFVLTHWPF